MRKLGFILSLGLLGGCAAGGYAVNTSGAQVISTYHDEIEIYLPEGGNLGDANRLARLHCSGSGRQLSPPRLVDSGNLLYHCFDTSLRTI